MAASSALGMLNLPIDPSAIEFGLDLINLFIWPEALAINCGAAFVACPPAVAIAPDKLAPENTIYFLTLVPMKIETIQSYSLVNGEEVISIVIKQWARHRQYHLHLSMTHLQS